MRDRHFLVAHRHRLSLIGDDPANLCPSLTDQPCPEWQARLSGALFTSAHGYDGPGVGTGNDVFSVCTYGGCKDGWLSQGQAAVNQHTDNWENWFTAHAPSVDRFLYLIDESTDYARIQAWASSVAQNPGPGRNLRSMATLFLPDAAAHTPALDIPTSTIAVGDRSQWQTAADLYTSDPRRRLYMYNAHRPASGSSGTEDEGVAMRELPWGQYKKHVDRWFMWEGTYYDDFQSGRGTNNLFHDALTFGTNAGFDSVRGQSGWNYANGDGVLFYPGTDRVFPADSYDVMGPFASLRLKFWRRGIQDVEYLRLAESIDAAAVRTIMDEMVPEVLWETGVSDPADPTWARRDIGWSSDPEAWERARRRLADIITGTTAGVTTTLTANPVSIASGQSSTLSWQGAGAASCTGTNFSTGGAASGTATVSPAATTTYTVTCSGNGGSATADAVVTVTTSPPPAATLSASLALTKGTASSTLTWTSADATSCTGTNFSTGNATSGSVVVSSTSTANVRDSMHGRERERLVQRHGQRRAGGGQDRAERSVDRFGSDAVELEHGYG